MSVSWCPMLDVWFPMSAVWLPLSNIWCPMSDFWCMISPIFDDWCKKPDVSCPMFDVHVRYPMCDVWCSVSYVRMCDVWCAMSDVRFLMSDVRLPLFDVFVYSKLEQNLPGQAKCEPTVVFLVGLSAELYANAYLCHGNIQWVKANLLKQYHRYSATTQTEDLERLSNHIFLKTKHPQGFVCKRTSVAEWLEFWNCNSEASNLRPALTAS